MPRQPFNLLAMDIGAGTADILFYDSDLLPANCPRIVAPSPTVVVGRRIDRLAESGKPIHLDGWLMGGGASTKSIFTALKKGVKISATPDAALTINDNLDKVISRGVVITDKAPEGARVVSMGDVNMGAIETAAEALDIDVPENVAVAVQDHGHSPDSSNRAFRFKHWQTILQNGGRLEQLYAPVPPPYMTRMMSVRKQVEGALVMDTGPAAILGALEDGEIATAARGNGMVALNFGNAHTLAFLIRGDRLHGLFEHHTRSVDRPKLEKLVERLQKGVIANEEVFDDGGHGAAYAPGFRPGGFDFIAATGPKRSIAAGLAHFAAPHGDMMFTGAFGLARAWRTLHSVTPPSHAA